MKNRWTEANANAWYAGQPWLVGCNFIPSTAINQLEMWQGDSFDVPTIQRELGWAAKLGMNTLRVYLHDLAWEVDASGFKSRIDRFLQITKSLNIRPLFVLFDDCWNADFQPGKQPNPKPGIHNSGWVQSPGISVVNDPTNWPRLEAYVRDIIGSFANDDRILMWDLYNEPGNSKQGEKSLPLLTKAFEWVRASDPSQPLSAALWFDNAVLNSFQLESSDVITFHNYHDGKNLSEQIQKLRQHGRPLICTEWLRRGHSNVADCLPVFARERVGCINWGLVAGKTQTIYPWNSPGGEPEPKLWFHDLFRQDGLPFDPAEVRIFKEQIAKVRSQPVK